MSRSQRLGLGSHGISRRAASSPRTLARWWSSLGLVCVIAAGLAGCDRGELIEAPDIGPTIPDGGPTPDAAMVFGDSSLARNDLEIVRVVPDHGAFTGGNVAVLRGAGYTDSAQVTFGANAVQPADHRLVDNRRLQVVVPAGDVGPVDVTVEIDGQRVTLEDAYTYDAISVDPNSGSVAGGTFITILGNGTSFAEGDTVLVGRAACTNVTIVSQTRITCRTPAAVAGTFDVTVVRAEDQSETRAVGAYTYFDSTDPYAGGLGGGAISGSINITVLNSQTGEPVPEAYAIVGNDTSTEHQGLTDSLGQITFSGPDLLGQQTVHIAKHCFERTSFVAFDARDVTVFLEAWQDPMCAPPGMPPSGNPRGRNGAMVEGELVWRGPNEYGPNPWDNIPEPRAGWRRVAYVFTTQRDVGAPNPDPDSMPGADGVSSVVLEVLPEGDHVGYPYRIFARPAGLAVYALAGLEQTETSRFIPYVMGVARNVLASPGATTRNVNVIMDIPLDHNISAEFGDLPDALTTGPDRFRLDAVLDLGGEGVIVRQVNANVFDTLRGTSAANPYRFVAQPALRGTLADARFRISAAWVTGVFDDVPTTRVVQNGLTNVDSLVTLADHLAIPRATAPVNGGAFPADRIVRWVEEGSNEVPDFHVLQIIGGDGNPAWSAYVRGDVQEIELPDFSAIGDLGDISAGQLTFVIYAAKIPGLAFDEFRYTYLNDRYWTHAAINVYSGRI